MSPRIIIERFWSSCIDAVFAAIDIPTFINSEVSAGRTHVEIVAFPRALREAYVQFQVLRSTFGPATSNSLEAVFQETAKRYNATLEYINRGAAGEFSADMVLDEMNREFIGWLPMGFLEPVAAAIRLADPAMSSSGIIATTNRLLELKPNFLGLGVNINALLDLWLSRK